ncbi:MULTISPECIES: basic amino acid/polyamine antiporter [Stenotrophomonas]|jgi:arginine:ornithine antiporter/lysine permease|uniref:Basic amino acid/polyamine antiporter n=1 Tax=Stenotrophomonas aracearum TaxID=3003272 RepID=A0ABY9YID4_9GAMM|nr:MULTISPECIES: basic amino acid/polyamine antiporter [unclassified Stenotrophomonas]WNH50445.1 basic amino acid/polyamine antiporter [Stenotrophomonas sp. A5588]
MAPTAGDRRLSLLELTALVVGSMIGSGIFALPGAFGNTTGVYGALLAWLIAGTGMLMLAFVFQSLSRLKPELDTGIYAYAKAGFGDYAGLLSAVGYWLGCCLADVACLILIKATLGQYFPALGDGTTVIAILSASLLLWGFHFLILRGIKEAALINTIATVAKLVPLAVFVVFLFIGFRADVFALNLWGFEPPAASTLWQQTRGTLLLTVFVFVGIEGASVYSRYARRREDVGIATVAGFLGVLCLLVMVTILSYGVLLRPDLAALATPSMAGVMEAIAGRWGALFISIGLLVSVLGNYLSWSLLAAEVLHSAALNDAMPRALARENKAGVPDAALWLTNGVIQAFLLVSWFADYAFTLALKMTSAMTLVPYLLVAAYQLKLSLAGEGGHARMRWIAGIATAYAAAMLLSGGSRYLLLSSLLYVPGSILFWVWQRQRGIAFRPLELLVLVVLCTMAVMALVGMGSGWLRL